MLSIRKKTTKTQSFNELVLKMYTDHMIIYLIDFALSVKEKGKRHIVWSLRAAPMVFYKLALSTLFHILIEDREKLSLYQELLSYTHFKII
jgi:hypothetical protein